MVLAQSRRLIFSSKTSNIVFWMTFHPFIEKKAHHKKMMQQNQQHTTTSSSTTTQKQNNILTLLSIIHSLLWFRLRVVVIY